jgi:mediator of RNA polymerase II transcription subunit 13
VFIKSDLSFLVILAPHGLSGTLTGVSYRMNEPGTHKILEEWKQFYPVEAALKSPMYDTTLPQGSHSSPHPTNSQNQIPNMASNSAIPPVVEVLVGGVRMRYPACYVLVTELDDPSRQSEGIPSSSAFPSITALKCKLGASVDSEGAACPSVLSPGKPQGSGTLPQEICKAGGILPERVWQEAILCLTKSISESNNSSSSGSLESSSSNSSQPCLGQWDFIDPTKRSPCTCSK